MKRAPRELKTPKLAALLAAAVLTSCVAAQYRAAGTQDMTVYAANRDCAHILVDHPIDNSGAIAAGLAGGAIGGLQYATDQAKSPEAQARDAEIDACMASHGWAKN